MVKMIVSVVIYPESRDKRQPDMEQGCTFCFRQQVDWSQNYSGRLLLFASSQKNDLLAEEAASWETLKWRWRKLGTEGDGWWIQYTAGPHCLCRGADGPPCCSTWCPSFVICCCSLQSHGSVCTLSPRCVLGAFWQSLTVGLCPPAPTLFCYARLGEMLFAGWHLWSGFCCFLEK